MIAAAAASSCFFLARQSRSRRASRLSASRLVSRSSWRTTGNDMRACRAAANACTRGVMSLGDPSRRRGSPTTNEMRPSSSAARRPNSATARSTASPSSPVVCSTATGLAKVRVTSLTATPILRSPTSSPATRPTSYNSRIPRLSFTARGAAVVATAATLTAVLIAAQAPPTPDTQGQRITDRIRLLQREADRLANEQRTLVGDLRKLEIERDLKAEQARQAANETAQAQTTLRETTDRLATLELQRLAQMPDMKQQLVDVYKRGRSGYARLIFGAKDAREFARAARAIASLASINQKRMEEHRRTLEALRRERTSFAQRAREVQSKEAAARQARAEAERAVEARSARMAEIDSRRDLTAQYVGELQVAYDKMQQQLSATERGEAVAVPLLPFRGALDWPAAGKISSRFGQSEGRLGGSAVKNGIEIGATEDVSVRAVHGGTVAYADAFTGLGTLVILDHGGNNYSLYGYLGSVAVQMGAMVETGAEIGRVGASPAGPPALYFELRIDGKPTDPVQWLKPR